MTHYPKDIYTEPDPSPDTLGNLGPLARLAGVWTTSTSPANRGMDVNPKADGPEHDAYVERYELQPIDAQTNGPQLFYGLRYHQYIVQPGEVETFHDQVGFWLWEPATKTVIQTLTIPRGLCAMASGKVEPDATSFRLEARLGSETNGVIANPFLDHAFKTATYSIDVIVNDDGTWSYSQTTILEVEGMPGPFEHTDRDTLHRIAEPSLNPTALAAAKRPR